MAIISCPECGGSVSSLAAACPHCGYGVAEHIAREKERENLHPDVRRLLDKIVPCEFTVPPPRAKVCIKCGQDRVEGYCEHEGVRYPLVEVDYPEAYNFGEWGSRLYIQTNCIEPRNIGDAECKAYKNRVEAFHEFTERYHMSPVPPDPKVFGKTREQYRAERAATIKSALPVKPDTPKCPTCGSTNISKISTATRAAHGFAFGLFSSTARSQFKCNACGYKW
ncbi:MAG: hypothetical protein LUE21_07205 [Oscillospiraceae bacterium]|nr:hypothetical protein [Oscillospiraceae bacterium]